MLSEYSKPYYKVADVSKYIIGKCIEDNSPITNLQLQRTLYYVQREFLSLDIILFEEDFEAWGFGPCVPGIYNEYCHYGGLEISFMFKPSKIELVEEFRVVIDHMIRELRVKPIWKQVEDICSKEGAWYEIYKNPIPKWKNYTLSHRVIPKELILEKG